MFFFNFFLLTFTYFFIFIFIYFFYIYSYIFFYSYFGSYCYHYYIAYETERKNGWRYNARASSAFTWAFFFLFMFAFFLFSFRALYECIADLGNGKHIVNSIFASVPKPLFSLVARCTPRRAISRVLHCAIIPARSVHVGAYIEIVREYRAWLLWAGGL